MPFWALPPVEGDRREQVSVSGVDRFAASKNNLVIQANLLVAGQRVCVRCLLRV
jgi:hypothetical protein